MVYLLGVKKPINFLFRNAIGVQHQIAMVLGAAIKLAGSRSDGPTDRQPQGALRWLRATG